MRFRFRLHEGEQLRWLQQQRQMRLGRRMHLRRLLFKERPLPNRACVRWFRRSSKNLREMQIWCSIRPVLRRMQMPSGHNSFCRWFVLFRLRSNEQLPRLQQQQNMRANRGMHVPRLLFTNRPLRNWLKMRFAWRIQESLRVPVRNEIQPDNFKMRE